ncbi:hypothetical protein EJ05DRAFT_474331 [Pseudovirgaria hyperparasitica]|uniref:Secreted protein n=1 Tax=Pseudovirgaria hyperparasitica TaxID=470096 RepID=A0A6A6WEZ1_9PEZI|nr:uncharacterized protein EJ05DRAFT_474331 [Pseudovirgaria hyperparasitica]KAF2760456.1 hypothetical protein EJ05DRAFT_474331 [Pseudovirgaria hyperparasitica]
MRLPSILVIIGITTGVVIADGVCEEPGWLQYMGVLGHYDPEIDSPATMSEYIDARRDYYNWLKEKKNVTCPTEIKYKPEENTGGNARTNKRYPIPEGDLPNGMKGGYVECREDEGVLQEPDIDNVQKYQLKDCHGRRAWGPRKDFPSGAATAFQCDSGHGQTCHPLFLAAMFTEINKYCGNKPGFFRVPDWKVIYGRQQGKGKLACA